MLFILSPSKTLDFEAKLPPLTLTQPAMLKESELLVQQLRQLSAEKLAGLMHISDKLATLNYARYCDFTTPFTPQNARPALFAFKGDVYESMEVASYSPKDLAFAQKHLRILSGLYGLLRPLDLMQPYRLEMGTALKNPRGKDLYVFWGDQITQALNGAEEGGVLVNLASGEYFKAIKPAVLRGRILHIVFKEKHKGSLKIIGLYAKRARGMMANYIIRHKVIKPQMLQGFAEEGYAYRPEFSGENSYVFAR